MATIATIGFHNQQMAENRERVRLRIANGLKSDSSNIITQRRMNPSYKGMIKNSTGSRNMPFFACNNEIALSLEDKIKARGGSIQPRSSPFSVPPQQPLPMETHVEETNQIDVNPDIIAAPFRASKISGGVLTDFKQAKKLLNRRKNDVLNIMRLKEGIPREATELTVLSELDSRKLELGTVLDYIGQSVAVGDYSAVSSLESRNLYRLIIALAPALTEDELIDIVRVLENIIDNLEEDVRDDTNGLVTLDARTGRRKQTAATAGISVLTTLLGFLREIGANINRSVAEKAQLAVVLARQLGSTVGLRDTLSDITKTVENVAQVERVNEETNVPEALRPTVPKPRKPIVAPPTAEEEYEMRKAVVLEEAQTAYAQNDIATLQAILRENAPRLRADKFFRSNASRTVLLNAIKNAL